MIIDKILKQVKTILGQKSNVLSAETQKKTQAKSITVSEIRISVKQWTTYENNT